MNLKNTETGNKFHTDLFEVGDYLFVFSLYQFIIDDYVC